MESGAKETLKRLILGELSASGPLDDEAIHDRLAEVYRRAGMPLPCLIVEDALHSLVCGRRIRKRPGRWDGQFWYSATGPITFDPQQQELFL